MSDNELDLSLVRGLAEAKKETERLKSEVEAMREGRYERGTIYKQLQEARAEIANLKAPLKPTEISRYHLREERDSLRSQLQSQAAQLSGMREILDALMKVGQGPNPMEREKAYLAYTSVCARALDILSTPPSEYEQQVKGFVQLAEDMGKADVTLLKNNLAAAWALKYWVRAREALAAWEGKG